jgi:hypothetical protein
MRHSPAEACRHILQQPDAALGGLEIAYVVFDVWATLQGQQQEDEGSAGGSSSSSSSSAAAARLPLVGPLDSQRQGIGMKLTLSARSVSRAGASSRAALWRAAATACVSNGGLPGQLKVECSLPLAGLVQQQLLAEGADHAALGGAWLSLVLRVLGMQERLERHGKLFMCLQDPATAPTTAFLPLSPEFDIEALKRKPSVS